MGLDGTLTVTSHIKRVADEFDNRLDLSECHLSPYHTRMDAICIFSHEIPLNLSLISTLQNICISLCSYQLLMRHPDSSHIKNYAYSGKLLLFLFEKSQTHGVGNGLRSELYLTLKLVIMECENHARPPHSIWYLISSITRISVLNSAKKGVYFKDFASPRFHENRGIFSIH